MIRIIFVQVLIMFLLSAVGYLMFKGGKISNEGSKSIGNILVYLSLPCVIINGFLVEKTPERLQGLLISAVLALLVLLLSMGISRVLLGRHALDNFAGSFSNPGFFGVPIIVATFSEGAVFYVASFIAFLNLLQWTYGVYLLDNSGEDGMLLKKTAAGPADTSIGGKFAAVAKRLIKAPFMIAILIGCFFFFSGIPMPGIFSKCITFIANVNTPLAMFTIGIYAAQTDLRKMFVNPHLYKVSAVKLICVPLLAILLFKILPFGSEELKTCVLIAAACPVGSNIAVYAQLHNKDYCYAVETVVLSTFLSIATLPMVVALANVIA
ncbi:MAG: AEC family transporter [Eubacteriales bacterium]|nr:AEC family transporter [Eubacteriales bacterium]